jgi:hypothetical protein
MTDAGQPPASAERLVCAECERPLTEVDRVEAGGKTFCRSCYEGLRVSLERMVAATGQDVDYPKAVVGAVLGGALGAAVWWGFTVVTHVAFGLVAVAIGFLAGHGALRLSGDKRTVGLQAIAAVSALVSFVVASYLVNMTFINRELERRGDSMRLGFPPDSLDLLFRVVAANFGLMDLVFVGIVVWQAWIIPRPLQLPPRAAA